MRNDSRKRFASAAFTAKIALDFIGVTAIRAQRETKRLGEMLNRFRDMDE